MSKGVSFNVPIDFAEEILLKEEYSSQIHTIFG
jgi:hypothetical protein